MATPYLPSPLLTQLCSLRLTAVCEASLAARSLIGWVGTLGLTVRLRICLRDAVDAAREAAKARGHRQVSGGGEKEQEELGLQESWQK